MIGNQKHLFDIPEPINYLACAAMSPLLRSVREAGNFGLDRKYHPWSVKASDLVEESEILRVLFARLINAGADDIAVVPSTAYGVATAAENLTLREDRSILVLQDQFPSNLYAWQRLAEERGGRLRVVPRPRNWDWTAAVLEHLDGETDIVSLPPCHWYDGSVLDLATIGARARELGAAFVIDATQTVGAMSMDVQNLKPDYLFCSGYKWLLCPYSISFMYAAPWRQNDRPLEIHGQNKGFGAKPDGALDYYEGFKAGARRFDMGERNNFINIPMAIAGLQQVNDWGPGNIQNSLAPLVAKVIEEAHKRSWHTPDPDHLVGHIVGLTPNFPVTGETISALEADGIYVTQRGPGIRISPHLYNDEADILNLFQALDRIAN